MLVLVCVLECLALTGLDLHVWLGFALCPLVLVHVVLQWQWFITQFQRIRTTRAYRVRINALLNLVLLFLMSAVLLSGILGSRQVTSLLGETFGRVRVWSEIHGWLNFLLVVLVGLHLALNWDWMVAALRRQRMERPGSERVTSRQVNATSGRRSSGTAILLGRELGVLLIASLTAGAVYFLMAVTMDLPPAPVQNRSIDDKAATGPSQNQFTPQDRPVSFPHGFEQLTVTISALALVVIIGRYVFRLRL